MEQNPYESPKNPGRQNVRRKLDWFDIFAYVFFGWIAIGVISIIAMWLLVLAGHRIGD